MPLGLIILSVLAGLVLFGAAQRVLDRMHLTDTQALVILGVIFLGSFIDIPIARGRAERHRERRWCAHSDGSRYCTCSVGPAPLPNDCERWRRRW